VVLRGRAHFSQRRLVGFANGGQKFTQAHYFPSPPSAVDYKANGLAGSNKGPSNFNYRKNVQACLDTCLCLAHSPGGRATDVPAGLITASRAGLDPSLPPQGHWCRCRA